MSEPQVNESQILLYQTEDGRQRIEVRLQNGSVWLNQKLLSELFGVGVNTVNYHIKEIYKDEELLPEATIRKYRIVQTEDSRQRIEVLLEEGLFGLVKSKWQSFFRLRHRI